MVEGGESTGRGDGLCCLLSGDTASPPPRSLTYFTYPLRPQWDIRPQQCFATRSCFAEAWASPQDSPISFSLAITDCRHVIFGRPRFLFPGGVHLSATLGMLSWGIRRTCPSHLSRLRLSAYYYCIDRFVNTFAVVGLA